MSGVGGQCGWGTSHGGDGFLCCGHDEGHDGKHHDVYQTHGTVPWDDERDTREWFPEWLWRSVVEQERDAYRTYRAQRPPPPIQRGSK